jgi:uncharacterized protein (DUF58 family)
MPAVAPASRFLDPAALAALRDLRLIARTVVEGLLAGHHLARRHAAGPEFRQYRAYEAGDDLRLLDWRAYARSDRFVVRESSGERDVTVRFLLDATASMAHEDSGLQKLEVARFLVAALAYLVDLQGDALALHVLAEGAVRDLEARRERAFPALLHMLEDLQPGGSWPRWDHLATQVRWTRRREVIVVVSDLHERDGEVRAALSTWRALQHEVQVFHLLGRNELEFGYQGDVLFEDLESGRTVGGSAERMRAPYQDALAKDLDKWRRDCLAMGCGYELVAMDEPLERALRGFLLRRTR